MIVNGETTTTITNQMMGGGPQGNIQGGMPGENQMTPPNENRGRNRMR